MGLNEIWAYISEDEAGNEGLCGFQDPNTKLWVPMIAADEVRMQSLKPFAHQVAVVTNRKVKLVKFHNKEELDTIWP